MFADICMMTSSNGNIFRVTGHLCGEFTGTRWIPHTKASDAELWCFFFIYGRINGWVNTGEASDLRRHRAHYDVIVMWLCMLTAPTDWLYITECQHEDSVDASRRTKLDKHQPYTWSISSGIDAEYINCRLRSSLVVLHLHFMQFFRVDIPGFLRHMMSVLFNLPIKMFAYPYVIWLWHLHALENK